MSRMAMMNRSASTSPRRGFTLIELLVVLGIIAILITLSITVGREVIGSGKERLTRDMIRVLDVTLTSWYGEKDSKFPAYLEVDSTGGPLSEGRDRRAAIIDGNGNGGTMPEPTLAMYLLLASETASVDTTLKQQIDAKHLGQDPLFTTGSGESFTYEGQGFGYTILDAWGRSIRFVHPVWHGGYGPFVKADGTLDSARPGREVPSLDGLTSYTYTRSYRVAVGGQGSADEGICPGNRPYFYSAGPDGDPGTREDNVYSTPPSFPPETAKLK